MEGKQGAASVCPNLYLSEPLFVRTSVCLNLCLSELLCTQGGKQVLKYTFQTEHKEEVSKVCEVDSTDSEENFSCYVCYMKFKDESALESHMYNNTVCYNYYMQDYSI